MTDDGAVAGDVRITINTVGIVIVIFAVVVVDGGG